MRTTSIDSRGASRGFSEMINRIVYSGRRFIVTRHGKPCAAVVTLSDLERLFAQTQARIAGATTEPK